MWKPYFKDQQGTFALKFALFGTILIMGAGIALDTARLMKTKTELQSLSDAATMAAALAYIEASKDPLANAGNFGRANFEENSSNKNFKKNDITFELTAQNTIKATADVSLKPMFMSAFGYPKLDLTVTSEVAVGEVKGAEIVLVVDATSSMAFDSNWDNVMQTVESTLSALEIYTGEDNVYISLVPFQDRVNIGTSRANWLSAAAPEDWNGCVEPREEPVIGFDFMLDNNRPETNSFEPNDPDTSGWGNTYCPAYSITGPSNDVGALLSASSSYSTIGTGRFDIGLAWGWRMLTPEWSGLWGVSNYPAGNSDIRQKYLVFMTDGRSSAYEREFSRMRDWDYNEGSVDGFEHLVELCADVKDDNIELFVIQFDGNEHATSYLQNCATSEDHYVFAEDVEEIAYPFQRILSQFSGEIRFVK